jgi:NADPH:quinone reductase-like Zn-dependent oxidoreductase
MSTMRALQFDRFGPPDVLSVKDVAVPVPKAVEVLVRVAAASINPSDVKNVEGRMRATLPRVPGRDFAGTVVSIGACNGKEVWGSGAGFGVDRDGAHAEFIAVPSSWLAEKPKHLSMAQAAACGIPYLAAWMGLVEAAALESGEQVLITGALGAVGRAATQVALWRGARVIGADRVGESSDTVPMVHINQPSWADQVIALSGGGVDVVLDAVGGPLFEDCLRCLRRGGRQVALASIGDGRVSFDLPDFFHELLHLVGIDTFKLEGEKIVRLMNSIKTGFEEGKLFPADVHEWELETAREAYSAVSKGTAGTRQVFVFD